MKKIINICLLWMCQLALFGQARIGDNPDYNPTNPGDPQMPDTTKYYNFSTSVTPTNGGSTNLSSTTRYAKGASINVIAYNSTGYQLLHWLQEDSVVSTASSFDYIMPAKDVILTAVFKYNPSNPADPDSLGLKYKLKVVASPKQGGSFNVSSTEVQEGTSTDLYAYPNTGYRFKGWQLGDEIVSTASPYTYTMGSEDVTITGLFEYNPSNPSNPGKNSWNETTGEIIVDDFTAGNLYSTITSAIGGSSSSYRQKVTRITVSGEMSSNDFSIANNFSKCTSVDLKRTYGYTDIPDYAYDYNTSLTSIILPASIETVGCRAFYQAANLADVTCYAVTPPTVEDKAFVGIADSATLYVLSAAIPLYAEAEGWKDFIILPLTEEVRTLEVNLPADSKDGRYKNMTLELVNVESGQRQKYVISDRVTYTFNDLLKKNIFNVYVKSSKDVVLGKIENIAIEDEDMSVTFESLLQPQNVTLKLQTPEGTDVTSQAQIRWFDSADNYLQQGNEVSGFLAGTAVRYHVILPQALGMQYVLPSDSVYTILEGNNAIECTLQPLEEVTICGRVKDAATDEMLSGVTVSVSQKLNGLYSKAFTVKTDSKGEFTAKVFNDQSIITVSATDYLNHTLKFANFNDTTFVGEIVLKNNVGITITTNLTYTTSVVEGETAEIQNWYADYANVAYEIYNETQGCAITQFNVQYPSIVLLEEVAEGDVLTLTASSRTNSFAPVKASTTISTQQQKVTFNIVELGTIEATFTSTDNASVVGILYDGKGQFVKKYAYINALLTISNLADGDYTLVSMTNNSQFNSILNLSQFAASGLKEGTDYVQNTVTVKSGVIATISNNLIPVLDESKFYYTGDNTLFSVNKTSIVAGNYLTLKGKIDFKSDYASKVSNVCMVVDLPESCSFVENSVMVGSNISNYTLDGNRLTIPLTDKYTDQVRFCVIPTLGGDYAPNAFAQFTLDGEEVLQPIGNATFAVKDLTISVPSTAAKTTIPIRGVAFGDSSIEIYDNGTKIGETTSLANGSWSTICELSDPYNLSMHKIYAKVTTKQGLVLQSETQECVYDKNSIEVKTVTMINISHRVGDYYEEKTVFDFQNPSNEKSSYWYWPSYPEFTFLIDFTDNDTTKISNVVLYVLTTKDNYVPLNASYDEKKKLWIASGEFGDWSNYDIPVNVAVDFDAKTEILADRIYFDSLENQINDARIEIAQVNEAVLDFNEKIEQIEAEYEYSIPFIRESISKLEVENNLENDTLHLKEFYELMGWTFDDSLVIVNPTIDDSQEFIDSLMLSVEETLSDEIKDLEELELGFMQTMCVADSITKRIDEDTQIADSSLFNYDERSFVIETAMGNYDYSEISVSELDMSEWNKESVTTIQMTDGSELLFYYYNDDIAIIDKKIGKAWILNKQESSISTYQNRAARITSEDVVQKLHEAFNALNSAKALITNMILDWTECVKSDISQLTSYKEEIEAKWMNELVESAQTQQKIEKLERQLQEMGKQVKNGTSANYAGEAVDFNDKIEQLKNKRQTLLRKAELHNKHISQYNARINGFKAKLAIKTALLGEIMDYWEIVTGIVRLLDITQYGIHDMQEWGSLIQSILPCDGDETAAQNLKEKAEEYRGRWGRGYLGAGALSLASTGLSGYCSFNKAAKFVMKTIGALVSDFIKETATTIYDETKNNSRNTFNEIQQHKRTLNCNEEDECPSCGHKPCICDKVCTKCRHNPCVCNKGKCPICGKNYCEHFQPPHRDPIHDPSGFVYEGVSSNRIEGVMASCYYKETVEDMYGDLHENVVLWDAEQYAQENPLFTDENGMYRWDVPQGLWQVKFEKEGYQTTYSEWLPVPPPQLEVNIAMTQNKQPEVKVARAYEDGIEIGFDKYMRLDGLTTENIFVTKNGETVAGTVTLLNEEQAYEDNQVKYASKLRFVPETSFLTTDEVTLTVSRKVKSYAGIQMENDYTQTFDIEKEVKSIVADSLIKVAYNGDKEITVSALPYDAAIGKKMIVKNSSSMIASISADTLTLDENGQATFTLNGDLPGTAMLTFSLADADVQTSSTVQVVSPELLMTASPKATRASGTAVYRGTEVGLTCETEGAVIYYTLDGSCPCDENAPRMVYENPITITEDMTIKAMAVVEDRDESEVAEFRFTIKTTNLGMNLKTGWNWVSHNMETEIPTTALPQNATRIVGQTAELIKDPVYGLIGNLSALQPDEAYKVQMTTDSIHVMSGYEFNPATSIDLKSGWNWLGYPVNQTMSLEEAFANMQPDNEDYIVGQDGFSQYADGAWTGTLQTLNPGMGYLYHSQSDKAFAYNSAIVSKARAVYGRGIKNETPWAVDKNKYPNVMPLVADVYVDGQKMQAGSYAVGAFCGTECRGVGKYVSGKLMMNIYGEANEKITFRAVNSETEEMFDIVEQVAFTETLQGSLYLPYALNVGNATSVSEIGINWKVWPTVATDNLYLSLNGNGFDRVTLIDVYGHVAFVKENVADGEAIRITSLADGVYIITAVQGGDTYYKKIVKAGK